VALAAVLLVDLHTLFSTAVCLHLAFSKVYPNFPSDPLPHECDTIFASGMDGILLPPTTPTEWVAGSNVEVGFALTANHGGGYSYRLCPANGVVNEDWYTATTFVFEMINL